MNLNDAKTLLEKWSPVLDSKMVNEVTEFEKTQISIDFWRSKSTDYYNQLIREGKTHDDADLEVRKHIKWCDDEQAKLDKDIDEAENKD